MIRRRDLPFLPLLCRRRAPEHYLLRHGGRTPRVPIGLRRTLCQATLGRRRPAGDAEYARPRWPAVAGRRARSSQRIAQPCAGVMTRIAHSSGRACAAHACLVSQRSWCGRASTPRSSRAPIRLHAGGQTDASTTARPTAWAGESPSASRRGSWACPRPSRTRQSCCGAWATPS